MGTGPLLSRLRLHQRCLFGLVAVKFAPAILLIVVGSGLVCLWHRRIPHPDYQHVWKQGLQQYLRALFLVMTSLDRQSAPLW